MKKGIILNAEAFGFGPSSAIAQLFKEIHSEYDYIAYIGEGHSLDLQKSLPYTEVITINKNSSDSEILNILRSKKDKYQYFLSALDFRFAQLAKNIGYQTAIYDPLLWFWKTVPKEILNCDLYITQNFYNVENILKDQKELFPKDTNLISPLPIPIKKNKREGTLINLGGLSNPFISDIELAKYASCVAASIKKDCKVTTSPNIAKTITTKTDSLEPSEVQNYLSISEIAIMSSGLGNIMEAAASNTPTLWLPPTNDSQGQQLKILISNNYCDAFIDWQDILPCEPIDYFKDQDLVMKEIQKRILLLNTNLKYQNKLQRIIKNYARKLKQQKNSKLRNLLIGYGHSGIKEFSKIVTDWSTQTGISLNFKIHNLTFSFQNDKEYLIPNKFIHQLSSHIPDLKILKEKNNKPDVIITHSYSNDFSYNNNGSHYTIKAPWDTVNDDLIHLIYFIVRKSLLKEQTYLMHAACLNNYLIIGHSGSGKTSIALKLIDKGHKILSGDKTIVSFHDGQILANGGTKTLTLLKKDFNNKTIDIKIKSTLGERVIFNLDSNNYKNSISQIKKIFLIKIGIINLNETISFPSSLHTLYPILLDKQREDLLIGDLLLEGAPAPEIKKSLIKELNKALQTIELIRIEGDPDFICESIMGLSS